MINRGLWSLLFNKIKMTEEQIIKAKELKAKRRTLEEISRAVGCTLVQVKSFFYDRRYEKKKKIKEASGTFFNEMSQSNWLI